MADSTVTVETPYHHDVQSGGTPIVPSQADPNLGVVPVANADGTPLSLTAGSLASAPITGQAKITTTGTRVQLTAGLLTSGVIIKAKSTNTANIHVGGSTVNNTEDGTGNGAIIEPGEAVSFAVANVNALYIQGNAGDIISYAGS